MDLFGSPNFERMVQEHDFDGLYRLLEHKDPATRLQAAQALAEMNDGAGWRFLMDTVRGGDIETRVIAVEMLGELGHPRAVPVLGEALLQTRYQVIDDDEFVTALRDALENIGGPEADEALRKAGFELVIPQLSHQVTEYDAHYVRPVLPATSEIKYHTAEEHLDLAVEHHEAEMPERGLVEISLALWLKPELAYAWYVQGVLYEDLDRTYEALLSYRHSFSIDPTDKDNREALEELENENPVPEELDIFRSNQVAKPREDSSLSSNPDLEFVISLTSRNWVQRRDSAAGIGEAAMRGDPRAKDGLDGLLALLNDEEREVRHAAIEAIGQLGDARAIAPLLALEDSSWLVRFAIIRALGNLGSVKGLVTALRKEMNSIQQRNPVFSSHKDPLLEFEYETLMETGVLALERTGDLGSLLALAEGNAWEEVEEGEEEQPSAGGESYYGVDEETEEEDEDIASEEEAEENMASYVDEAAEMAAAALDRLATAKIATLDPVTLKRLSVVPDLTLMDAFNENAQPAVVYDLSALRALAQAELTKRG
ncbi:MAG TPA: HEAT repeat domain-containing protein [Anaerolineaceae bacterium]